MIPSLTRKIAAALAALTFMAMSGNAFARAAAVVARPTSIRQNQALTIGASDFQPYVLLTVTLDGSKISNAADYSDGQGALTKSLTLPASLADGVHQIQVTDVYGDAAQTSVTVGGAYVPATLIISPRRGLAGQEVSLKGSNWQKRAETVTLSSLTTGASQALAVVDACLMNGPPTDPDVHRTIPAACGVDELFLVEQIPTGIPPGFYKITVSDGLSHAEALFHVLGPSPNPAPKPAPKPRPAPNPTPQPNPRPRPGPTPQAPVQIGCNPAIPSYQQPACRGDAPTPGPVNPPPAQGEVTCDPAIPTYQQPGCHAGEPAPGPINPPPAQGQFTCDPAIPTYQQPGCHGGEPTPGPIDPGPQPAPVQPGACNPDIPRYQQPGCRS